MSVTGLPMGWLRCQGHLRGPLRPESLELNVGVFKEKSRSTIETKWDAPDELDDALEEEDERSTRR